MTKNSFFPSYVFALLIFILSSLPGGQLTKVQQYPDNVLLRFLLSDPVMHWGVFAVLSGLLCFGFYRSLYSHFVPYRAGRSQKSEIPVQSQAPYGAGRSQKSETSNQKQTTSNQLLAIKVILLGIGYVLFIEIYQAILPWRNFGVDDILWGSGGVVSVVILVTVALNK